MPNRFYTLWCKALSKNWIVIAGIFSLFGAVSPPALHALDYNVRQTAEKTVVIFRSSNPLSVTELNAPANSTKIFLKIGGIDPFAPENDPGRWQIPTGSAVSGYRLIPYNRNTLLVIDLLHPVPYQVATRETGFQLMLDDGVFRDPITYDYMKGMYWHRHGELKQALAYYQSVLRRKPNHACAEYKMGQIRLQWEDYREAEIHLKNAVKNGCDSAGVYKALAQLYRIYGNRQMVRYYENEYRQLASPVSAPDKNREGETFGNVEFAGMNDSLSGSTADVNPGEGMFLRGLLNRLVANPWFWAAGLLGALLLLVTAVQWTVVSWKAQRRMAMLPKEQPDRNQKAPVGNAAGKSSPKKAPQPRLSPSSRRHQPHVVIQSPRPQPSPAQRMANIPTKDRDNEAQVPEADALIDALLKNRSSLFQKSPDMDPPDSVESGEKAALELSPFRDQKEDLREFAQRMNLGIGEVELALKLSSLHHQSHRARDVRQQILALYFQDLGIDEIARKTGLGKGEIELFLRLNRAPVNSET